LSIHQYILSSTTFAKLVLGLFFNFLEQNLARVNIGGRYWNALGGIRQLLSH